MFEKQLKKRIEKCLDEPLKNVNASIGAYQKKWSDGDKEWRKAFKEQHDKEHEEQKARVEALFKMLKDWFDQTHKDDGGPTETSKALNRIADILERIEKKGTEQ